MSSTPEVVRIRAPSTWPGFALGELWRFRTICIVLARRALMVRYRQTVVGAGWTILQPLMLMLLFTVFFGLLSAVPSAGIPYPVFFLTGLVIWQLVAKILNEGTVSVVANAELVSRVYFPRSYFPIAAALSSLVDLAISLVVLAVVLVAFGIVPGAPVLAVPALILIGVAAVLGVTFWLAALNAAYRDVAQLMPFATQLWFFASPVLYPSSIIPEPYQTLYWLNPVALVIEGFRWAVANGPPPPAVAWPISLGMTAFLLISGYLFYRHRESTFSDVV